MLNQVKWKDSDKGFLQELEKFPLDLKNYGWV